MKVSLLLLSFSHSLPTTDYMLYFQDIKQSSLPDLWVAFHLYLEPAFAEVLYDRVIVFRPKE